MLPTFGRLMHLNLEHKERGSGQHLDSEDSDLTANAGAGHERALLAKLSEELREYSAHLEQMLRLNSAWYQAGAPKPDDDASWRKVADLYGCADNDLRRIRADLNSCPSRRSPFPENELASLRERVACTAQRISDLDAQR